MLWCHLLPPTGFCTCVEGRVSLAIASHLAQTSAEQEQSSLSTLVWDTVEDAWAKPWEGIKEEGLVGMDTEVWHGDSGGGSFPTPNTPCPVLCLMRGAMGTCVGQWGCTSTGTAHRFEPQENYQETEAGTGSKKEFRNMT